MTMIKCTVNCKFYCVLCTKIKYVLYSVLCTTLNSQLHSKFNIWFNYLTVTQKTQ